MSRRPIHFLGFVTIVFFLAFRTAPFAQQLDTAAVGVVVPRLVTFSGILRDGRGQQLQKLVGVTFSLYKDQEGGSPLWTENQNVTLDEQGRYSVLLGATQASGLPMDIFASGESRWLGVQAQLPGEEEQPRVLLVSVPYALKAGDADTFGGKPLSAFLLAQPADQTDPGDAAHLRSKSADVSPRFTASGPGTSTPNRSVKWTDAIGTLDDGSIQDNGSGVSIAISNSGKVGIGNTGPSYVLDVAGGASSSSLRVANTSTSYNVLDLEADGTGGAVQDMIRFTTSAAQYWSFGTDQANANALAFTPASTLNATTPTLLLTQGGKVGVGTISPSFGLDVAAGLNTGSMRVSNSNPNYNVLDVEADGTGGAVQNMIRFTTKTTQPWSFGADQSNSSALTFTPGPTLSGGPALLLTRTGNVGVGTSSPAAKLDVNGTAKATSFVGDGSLLTNIKVNGVPGSLLNTRGIVYLAGCDTCGPLQNTDSQQTIYVDVIGSMTVNSVACYSDTGSPEINIHRGGAAGNMLQSDLHCSNSGSSSAIFVSGANSLILTDTLDFVMVSAGGANRVTVAIQATVTGP